MRTITLTERRTKVCRLAPEDVTFLLQYHHSHLRLIPTETKNTYRLTPTHFVGLLAAPRCRILIQPKVPLHSIFLLHNLPELRLKDNNATLQFGQDLLELFTHQMLTQLREHVSIGLQSGYVERDEQATFLRGRLNVAAQLRESTPLATQFHCHADEFTTDVRCNQILKSTLELLRSIPLLSETARLGVVQALGSFETVSTVPLNVAEVVHVSADPAFGNYRTVLEWCRLIVEGLQPSLHAGQDSVPSFLLNMERLFEQYVAQGLQKVFALHSDLSVTAQRHQTIADSSTGQADLSLCPDVTVVRDGRTVLVLDTKWKRLAKQGPETDDLYQLLSYCTTLGASRGILLYPGKRARAQIWTMRHLPLTVEAHSLPIVGTTQECHEALERFSQRLLKCVRTTF